MQSSIMAVLLRKRTEDAPKFQEIITKHGCIIRLRVGIHEVENCAEDGLILLQLSGSDAEIDALAADINQLEHARAKLMKLDF